LPRGFVSGLSRIKLKVNQNYLLEAYMSQAKDGDTVKIHYTGKLENGTVFDTSKDRQPLEFAVGNGKIIPGFEKAIIGMGVGDTKTITVQPEEAYGPSRKELIMDIKKTDLPEDITPAIGKQLQIRQKDGNPIEITITDMDEDTVTLDANHPLAGNTLVFEVELVEIA
jgi:peptidylprolyl isomerase